MHGAARLTNTLPLCILQQNCRRLFSPCGIAVYHDPRLSPGNCWGNSQGNEPLAVQCITAFRESVSPTDRHGRDALDFFNLSGCVQLVRCPTQIVRNRLDLVTTDVPDIVDVFVGTPLGTSDHCFVSYVLRVEQSVPEYKVRSTAFLKYRTNWDSVRCAVRSFTWSTILKLAEPSVAFDRAISEVIARYVPTTALHSRSGDKQWFDASWVYGYIVLRHRGYMVLQGSLIMNAPEKLWSTPPIHISGGRHLKARALVWNLIFLLSGGPWLVWWWLLLRKPHFWALSLTANSVVSSLLLLCLVSLSLGAILWPSEFLSSCVCFLILIHMGRCFVDHVGAFPQFLKTCGCYCSKTKHNFFVGSSV